MGLLCVGHMGNTTHSGGVEALPDWFSSDLKPSVNPVELGRDGTLMLEEGRELMFTLSLYRDGRLGKAEAQACLTANLGLPGAGSLMAGRRVGYAQVAVALAGMGLTLVFGVSFIVWCVRNIEQLRSPELDPVHNLVDVWLHLRWALLGLGLFAVAWLWALGSSLGILSEARRSEVAG